MNFRKGLVATLFAAMAFAPHVSALDMKVGSPPDLDWGLVADALKDGKLDPGDLVGPAFQTLWAGISQEIGRVNLCRSVMADILAGSQKPPYTDYVDITIISPDGRQRVTYQQPVRVFKVREGVHAISPIKADGSYGRGIICGGGLRRSSR